MLSNDAHHRFKSRHVGCAARPSAARLGGRIDRDKHNVRLADALGDVGREEKIRLPRRDNHRDPFARVALASTIRRRAFVGTDFRSVDSLCLALEAALPRAIAGDPDDIAQSRLVDGEMLGIPPADPPLVSIHDSDAQVRVLIGHYSRRGTAFLRVSHRKPPVAMLYSSCVVMDGMRLTYIAGAHAADVAHPRGRTLQKSRRERQVGRSSHQAGHAHI